MRIVGYIDHPTLKITLFKMDNKFSVKFESGLYEQTYKFRSGEGVESVNDIHRLVDPEFISAVEAGLQGMHRARIRALSRLQASAADDEFDSII